MERDEMLTVAEVAEALGVSTWTIHKRLKAGTMKGESVRERVWLIPASEIERWRELPQYMKRGPKPRIKEAGSGS